MGAERCPDGCSRGCLVVGDVGEAAEDVHEASQAVMGEEEGRGAQLTVQRARRYSWSCHILTWA